MKKNSSLQWFLIKKFIVILVLVGIAEYIITLFINTYVMPVLFEYFFSYYENISISGTQIVIFLITMFAMLIVGAVAVFVPYNVRNIIQVWIETLQKNMSGMGMTFYKGTSIYKLDRIEAVMLFLLICVLIFILILPYVLGSVYFAKIIIKEFRAIQAEREEQIRSFDKKRNLMLSDIAHDLRTPITTINGYAKAISDGMVKDISKQQEYLLAIQNKSVRMNELINLLFEYVKLDSEGFELQKQRFDLYELLRENVALIYKDAEDAGMNLIIDIPEKPFYVSADFTQLSRVLTNLLNNAIRHNDSGTDIHLSVNETDDEISVVIADNGRRLADDIAEHIFEPFAKGEPSRNTEGSGLGLSIAKKVIDMHGWNLKLLQGENEMCTKEFVITLKKEKTGYVYG